jgi:predicted MFS family arabinose efflux permease
VGRLAGGPEIKVGDVVDSAGRARLLVPTLVTIGSLMAVVSSLGAPLIPTLSRTDGVSLSTGEWILTITLLTGALVTPIMGRLADGSRQRDVIFFTLGCVVVGCMVAAV